MVTLWTGSNVGQSPPTKEELKALTEGLIIELNLTGTRAARLRQAIRPWLHPTYEDWAPAVPPPPTEEELREAVKNISEQLELDMGQLLERVGLK